jgi:hypothetical protein
MGFLPGYLEEAGIVGGCKEFDFSWSWKDFSLDWDKFLYLHQDFL